MIAIAVQIINNATGKSRYYRIGQVIQSNSRGFEYQLLDSEGRVCRVCHAPPFRVRKIVSGDETLKFTYPLAR